MPTIDEVDFSLDYTTSLDKLDRGFLKTVSNTGILDICE
jgi:hypothetical protein